MATIRCATEGASIAYRHGESGRWLLYSAPVAIAKGQTVQAQACRLGFRDSQQVSATAE